MLLRINELEDAKIKYDWKTLYVALYLDFIDISVLSDYSVKEMSNKLYVDNEFITELAWGGCEFLKEELLAKMPIELGFEEIEKNSIHWNYELRKLRYCMLRFARNTISNNKELLSKVSEIYADVGYPVEMEEFIPYMPPKDGYDPTKYSIEENNLHMIMLLDKFLEEEKKVIAKLTS
ncbi:hypothetical protein SAMN02745134_03929 [Clostridium acidisoli DSM 12555]|uniref:DUF2247 family protein n=1 Tax=Clostridium acidisoli DSM 12555 TaxID=1121291 RepID=A0A1W1Y052_9CLOT|nr:DUF2247 family protein [Clostridium acidisoli]SMC29507.1 hypothetical protein SAMN02745134_03929 [Clostridium acidisoli DSM 12555]